MGAAQYNILTEGDRHLLGKLAEIIFERVRNRLLKNLTYCGAGELRRMLADQRHLKFDLESILAKFKTGEDPIQRMLDSAEVELNGLIARLGIEKSSLAEVRWDNCILCREMGEELVHASDHSFHFLLCKECLSKCRKSGLIYGNLVQPGENEFVFRSYDEAMRLSKYSAVFHVLSKLDEKKLNFLIETYAKLASEPGQTPFDYIGVNEEGRIFLIDVTSTVLGGTPPLSKRERRIAKEAAELGFNIVQPLIVFLEDWNVKAELKGIM